MQTINHRVINKQLKHITKLLNHEEIEREYIVMKLSDTLQFLNYSYQYSLISKYVFNDKFSEILELVDILNLKKPAIKTLGELNYD